MGQKLEKLSEKDEDLQHNSDWSERTEKTQGTEADVGEQDRDSLAIPRSVGEMCVTGHSQKSTVTLARTDPQTGQPIRPLGQPECPLNTVGQQVGGVSNSQSVTRAEEELKTVLRAKETRRNSRLPNNKQQTCKKQAVVCFGTAAMEEQRKGTDIEGRNGITSCDPENEEDFVVLERDETWVSKNGENMELQSDKIKTANLQSPKTTLDDNHSHSSQEFTSGEQTSRRKSIDRAEASVRSSPAAFLESKVGSHLVEVTSSRCQLKGVGQAGTAHTWTTGRELGETNDQSTREVVGHPPTPKTRGLLKRIIIRKTNDECEIIPCEPDGMTVQKEPVVKMEEPEEADPISGAVQCRENHNPQVTGNKTQEMSKFAGAVSKRSKTSHVSLCSKKEDSQAHANSTKPSSSPDILQLQSNPLLFLEQCDLMPGFECCNGMKEVASFKKESALVCFSAVVTPPPLTHVLPDKDTSQNSTKVNSQTAPESVLPNDESIPKEKTKVKGPPPPVPKKPKNPFIKLKTAQLQSTEVQKRSKDHLRSEERVKRRHTFHFNNKIFGNMPVNQDMCQLWDERGTLSIPSNQRHLSIDLSPLEQLSLGQMDEQYGDMVDFDYCAHVADLSPDEEPRNLDMLQRRVFLERRLRYKAAPPPVARKPVMAPSASTESLEIPEVLFDHDVDQTEELDCCKRGELDREFMVNKVSSQVTHNTNTEETGHNNNDRDARTSISDVGSFKPVAEIIKETNQIQRRQSWTKNEGPKAQIRLSEQSSSVKVAKMKNTFDIPKKSKQRPQEVQAPPKKGKHLKHFFNVLLKSSLHGGRWTI